jgi:hypothetical protein
VPSRGVLTNTYKAKGSNGLEEREFYTLRSIDRVQSRYLTSFDLSWHPSALAAHYYTHRRNPVVSIPKHRLEFFANA